MAPRSLRMLKSDKGDTTELHALDEGRNDQSDFVPKFGRDTSNAILSLRTSIEIFIFVGLFLVLVLQWQSTPASSTLDSIMPDFAAKSVLFKEDKTFSNVESFENKDKLHTTMQHWTRLSPRSRGTVYLSPSQRYGLSPPYNMSGRTGQHDSTTSSDVYIISVFHQLHCLAHLMETYGVLVIEGQAPKSLHHIAHCFDYLRQGILCAGDTTIEGQTKYGSGWGSNHQCKDIMAIREWVDKHEGLPIGDFSDHL